MLQGTLVVKPISANLTYDAEIFGKMDCYCKLALGGEIFKTKPANSQGKHPTWDESFTFHIKEGQNTIEIQIIDKHHISSDDYVGTVRVNLMDIFQRKHISENFIVSRKGKDIGHLFLVLEFHPQDQQMGGPIGGQMGVPMGVPIGGQMGGQMGGPIGGQMGGQGGHTRNTQGSGMY